MATNTATLHLFLQNRKVDGRNHEYSMTGMTGGKWMVTDSDYPQFLDELHKYLFEQGRRPIGLVEQRRAEKMAPLLIDLDFKYASDRQLKRAFKSSHIETFVSSLTNILDQFYDLGAYGTSLRFFICLRPAPYDVKRGGEKIVKDGIHITCPDLVVNVEHQQVIRAAMLDADAVSDAFGDTSYENKDTDVYDEAITAGRNGWFFYGESKPDIPAYRLEMIYEYDHESKELSQLDHSEFTSRELMDTLGVRQVEPSAIKIRPEMRAEWDAFKRPVARNTVETPKVVHDDDDDVKTVITESVADTVSAHIPKFARESEHDEGQVELAKRLALECLSAERMDSYHTWYQTGLCLHNIDNSLDMFNVWMECSAKSPKYRQNNVDRLRYDWERQMSKHDGEKLTLRSLRYWAMQDNPEKYHEIVKNDIIDKIQTSVDVTNDDVAEILYDIFWDKYKCTSVGRKGSEWYQFKNHIWEPLGNDPKELKNSMRTDLIHLILIAQQRLASQFGSLDGTDLKSSQAWKRFELLHKLIQNLKNTRFKDQVITACENMSNKFHIRDFANKLNNNPYLIGCANGILNLRAYKNGEKPRVEFRPGRGSDMVSMKAGKYVGLSNTYENNDDEEQFNDNKIENKGMIYVPYDPSDPAHAEMDEFFSKIFPNEDLRAWMWRYMASLLEGRNHEQFFYLWIGGGGNGKSQLVKFLEYTLGEYVGSCEPTVLTRKRPEAGNANPELMALQNKRFIYMQEPEAGEPVNTSRMKQFSGGDKVKARPMFEDQKEFIMTGKLAFMCNGLPPIYQHDRGVWRRVHVIPFVSFFVPEGDPLYNPSKNYYHIDPDMDNKMMRWRVPFFSRLVHIYINEYVNKSLDKDIPDIIKQQSQKYKEEFDTFAKFRNDCIRTGGRAIGCEAGFNEINTAFLTWYGSDRGMKSGAKRLQQSEFKDRLANEFGTPVQVGTGSKKRDVYRNIKVFRSADDAEEWDNEE